MSMQGRVVWHDLNTTNLEQARGFYGELFGWKISSEGPWSFISAGGEEQHFGAMMQLDAKHQLPSHWVPYLTVADLDAAVQKLTAAGGKIHMGKTPAGKTGHFAYVADPGGAVFSLWQYADGSPKPEQDTPPPAGRFCWDELHARDTAVAAKFYSQVIGYQAQTMDMPGMPYTIWLRDAKRPDGSPRQAGGMAGLMPGEPQPYWLSYVAVADCDQSVDKAKRLGATALGPTMDVPDVGRIQTLQDPTGAVIAVLGPGKK